MCKCTPNIRTPYCGKFGCEWPKQENTRPTAPQNAECTQALQWVLRQIKYASEEPEERKYYLSILETIRAALNQPRPVVKPLAWEKNDNFLPSARTPFFVYEIDKVVWENGDFQYEVLSECSMHNIPQRFDTIQQAKAAAEAHWQQKIGECLTDSAQLAAQEGGEG